MCSYIVEKAALTGSAKGRGWMKIDTAHVYYDHPFHAPLDHALGIDFINEAQGGRERVAVELSAASARERRGGAARVRSRGVISTHRPTTVILRCPPPISGLPEIGA